MLAAAGMEPSMSRAGHSYDNAAMESFMAICKRECVALAEGAAVIIFAPSAFLRGPSVCPIRFHACREKA